MKTSKMFADLRRALALVDQGQAKEALDVYRALLVEAQKAGFETAYLHYVSAYACLALGDLEAAFGEVSLAVERDPLAVPFRSALEDVTRRIREVLADPAREAADPSTPRLYRLLVQGDAADVTAHVVMGRHLLATGERDAARALATALTQLHPASEEAWELAGDAGDRRAAEQARGAVLARGTAVAGTA